MTDMIRPEWIALDWGTTNLRAFAMQGSRVLAKSRSSDGMSKLARDGFEPAMVKLIEPWLQAGQVPILACGMVGSRQGWVEAPYRSVPCNPLGDSLAKAPSKHGFDVRVIHGLSQASPADVMRGEETQIAGFLALNPGWDGVLCMPGTHTKWVHLSAEEVVSFQSFMTGELFDLLSNISVLRHSMSGEGWDAETFLTAVSDAISAPERLAARLFNLRAADLLQSKAPDVTRASLSGYLVGAELAAARAYWLGQNIAILGMGRQARAYETALQSQGAFPMLVDTERATLAGLTAAYRSQKELT